MYGRGCVTRSYRERNRTLPYNNTEAVMKAKDLMIPLQEYLTPETTLKEAASLLRTAKRDEEKFGVKALPVLDKVNNLIGILSIGDILKAVFPAYLSQMDLG